MTEDRNRTIAITIGYEDCADCADCADAAPHEIGVYQGGSAAEAVKSFFPSTPTRLLHQAVEGLAQDFSGYQHNEGSLGQAVRTLNNLAKQLHHARKREGLGAA